MKIGDIIKEERLKRNLTQEDLAQVFFVTRQLVSKWENNRSYPDLDQVVKISELFDLPLDYLLKGDQQMTNQLNFDSKLKHRLKLWGGLLTVIISSAILTTIFFLWFFDEPSLTPKDIEITKIEKMKRPAKTIVNRHTGQKWAIPADIEYLIHFKTNKPFVDLARIAGIVERIDPSGIEIEVTGHHKFGRCDTESTIWVRGMTEPDSLDYNFIKGKDLYLYKIPRKPSIKNERPQVSDSYKFLSWEQLNNLPFTKFKIK
ncbi:helix-turn-helix transcriptional regulator [Xylocopilactobacillus apis]|uniref:helix-turn-helix domain-containing protein n=1 Tax=Xylocopilactobacillus apis TaxID=2932183 RepID=UPI00295542C2|nr:helix-turn-helix transcriptional regulator [Xylocopilactobacillus apis]